MIRETAVRMCCEQGFSKLEAADALGVTRQGVGKWIKLYEEGGWESLKLGRRGRKPEEQAKLKNHQCATIVRIITDKTPELPPKQWTQTA